MNREVPDLLDQIDQGLTREEASTVLEATRQLRETVEDLLADRSLEAEDRLLRDRRHLHQRLEVLEAKAEAGRFDDAEEDAEAVDDEARALVDALRERGTVEPASQRPARPRLRAGLAVARREATAILAGPTGGILAAVTLLVLTLALQATPRQGPTIWATARTPLLVLAPLAGLAVGLERLADDRRAGRLPLLAAGRLSRAGVVGGKAVGAVAALALVLLGPALLVLLAGALLGSEASPSTSALVLLAVFLLATSFAAIGFALDTLEARRSSIATGAIGAYLVLGPVWQAAFAAGGGDGTGAVAALVLRRLSPVAAAEGVFERVLAGGLEPAGWGLTVLAAWTVAGLGWAALRIHRRGFGRADRG